MIFQKASFLLVLFLSACSELDQNKYSPPTSEAKNINFIMLDKSKDLIWPSLIDLTKEYSGVSVNNKERLIIIDLTLPDVSKYINCGMMNDEIYVDYIHRIFESTLTAKLYIRLDEIDINRSNIQLDASYTFISLESGTTWEFSSNKPATIWVANPAEGALPQRICLSKNTIETNFINKIMSL